MKKVMPKFMPMQNVLLTYKDEVVNLADPVSKYKNNATFILHEGEVAEELSNHSGLLWECVDCNLAYTYKSKFKEMEKRGKKCGPHNHAHNKFLFFYKAKFPIPNTWGKLEGKGTKPWGCPRPTVEPVHPGGDADVQAGQAGEDRAEAQQAGRGRGVGPSKSDFAFLMRPALKEQKSKATISISVRYDVKKSKSYS